MIVREGASGTILGETHQGEGAASKSRRQIPRDNVALFLSGGGGVFRANFSLCFVNLCARGSVMGCFGMTNMTKAEGV